MGLSRKPESKEDTSDRSMARLLTILAVLAVFVLAISTSEQSRPGLAGDLGTAEGLLRTKRSRADSRYNPGTARVNPNRGRKRVRLSDGRPEAEVRTERPVEQVAFTAPRNFNRGATRFQDSQPTSPPRNFNRGQTRFQEPQPLLDQGTSTEEVLDVN
eukprot:TRINITY_DN28301_c0_g1_i1.p1 TRINITY_DN28301_c0_g1~~TRINITY_DN28301_c0_g1_i1.p1  ORF type:complete len:166 (-),score=34.76 TRINITY_DN28301_c0_g1_i1:392-865(-)